MSEFKFCIWCGHDHAEVTKKGTKELSWDCTRAKDEELQCSCLKLVPRSNRGKFA